MNAQMAARILASPAAPFVEGAYALRVAEVAGRRSGQPRRAPVGVVTFQGARYLVSPNRQRDWARNILAAGAVSLLAGDTREAYRAALAPAAEAVPVLRLYVGGLAWAASQFPFALSDGDDAIAARLDQMTVLRLDPA
jgi:deazaflavin-dependent oxidoreductase (nitroreductase family)